MRDLENTSEKFESCHGGGRAYETYKKIRPKFTDEFLKITFELMVETYLRTQMDRRSMNDNAYVNTKNVWRSIAEELGVLREYPYTMDSFPSAHPMAHSVAREAKKRLGIG